MRTSPPITITDEIPGDLYPDLETAQRVAMPRMVENMQSVIRELIEQGVLVNVNGMIIPNPDKSPVASPLQGLGAEHDAKTMYPSKREKSP